MYFNTQNYPFISALPLTISQPSRLRLFPRPETARWLGFSSLSTSSDALSQASASELPPRLRYVGMFILVEALIRTYVENPHTPPPPQRQHEQFHQHSGLAIGGAGSRERAEATSSPIQGNTLTTTSEETFIRDTMVDVLNHLVYSWWVPSAAFISVVSFLAILFALVI